MAGLYVSLVCLALLANVASSFYTVVEQEYATGVPGLESHSLVIYEGDENGESQPIAEVQTLEATGETATSVLGLLTCVITSPFLWFDKQAEFFQELENELIPDTLVVTNDGIPTTEGKTADELLQGLKVARLQDALSDYAALQDRLWSFYESTNEADVMVGIDTANSTITEFQVEEEDLSGLTELVNVLGAKRTGDILGYDATEGDQPDAGFELVLETFLSLDDTDYESATVDMQQDQYEIGDEDYELSNIDSAASLEKLVLHLAALTAAAQQAAAGTATLSESTAPMHQDLQQPAVEVLDQMSWSLHDGNGQLNTSLVIFIVLCVGCLGMAIGFLVTLVQLQRTVSEVKVADGGSRCQDMESGLTAPLMVAKGYQQPKLAGVEVAADYLPLPTCKQ